MAIVSPTPGLLELRPIAETIREMDACEPGTWLHPAHVTPVCILSPLLEIATGDRAGWGTVRDETTFTEAALTAQGFFRLTVADANALPLTCDATRVPSTIAQLQNACAVRGFYDIANGYEDFPLLGAASRLFDIGDTTDAVRALAALRRHYVPVFVQCTHLARRFAPDEGTQLGAIGELEDSCVGACTICNIANDERYAKRALRWLNDKGAIDVRALSLADHEYYLLPASVAGVLRALIGRCHGPCAMYKAPTGKSHLLPGTCACDIALEGLQRAVYASLHA